jgi:hypothetical protein
MVRQFVGLYRYMWMTLEEQVAFSPEGLEIDERRIRATTRSQFFELAKTAALAVQYGKRIPDNEPCNQEKHRFGVAKAGDHISRLVSSLTTFVEYPEITTESVPMGSMTRVTYQLAVPPNAREKYARELSISTRLMHGISVSYRIDPGITGVGYVHLSTGSVHGETALDSEGGVFLNVAADRNLQTGEKILSAASGVVLPNGIVDYVEQDGFSDAQLWANVLDAKP